MLKGNVGMLIPSSNQGDHAMNTAQHKELNALVTRCCNISYEADKIASAIAALTEGMVQTVQDDEAHRTNDAAVARLQAVCETLDHVSCLAYEAVEGCNWALLP
jgi:hypothetical protein